MSTNEKLTEVLNDLIRINNDRTTGYEKAFDESRSIDVDLQATFNKMANESRKYAAGLRNEVERLGGEPATGTTNSGKIYRVWMDLKATFTGHGRHSVLESCEFGEDAAQKAYEKALNNSEDLPPDIRTLIQHEKDSLRSSHDMIKQYRDRQRDAEKK